MFQLSLNFDIDQVIEAVKAKVINPCREDDDDERPQFSDNEVVYITYRVLEDALEILGRKGCAAAKTEILAWIFAPDYQQYGGAMRHSSEIPFSFQFCCRALGFKPDDLQTELQAHLNHSQPAIPNR